MFKEIPLAVEIAGSRNAACDHALSVMRSVTLLSLALGMSMTALQPLSAQNSQGNVEAGRRYAIDWCSGCHAVVPKTVGIFAADFAEIAKVPSTTTLSLKVFLRTSHPTMPNFILQPEQADDIVAYILSLRDN